MAARVDRHWARFFGVDVAMIGRPGVHVVPHAGLGDYAGVWLFRRGAGCLVSAPRALATSLAAQLAEHSVSELGDREAVAALFPGATQLIGPAFHASVAPDCFRPRDDPETRRLEATDAAVVEALHAACPAEDWEAGGPPDDPAGDAVGCFRDGALVALATPRRRGADACDVCVVTHPAWRGRGCGGMAVSAAVQQLLERDLLVLYMTLVANTSAVALARALGFDPYATHLAVRLA